MYNAVIPTYHRQAYHACAGSVGNLACFSGVQVPGSRLGEVPLISFSVLLLSRQPLMFPVMFLHDHYAHNSPSDHKEQRPTDFIWGGGRGSATGWAHSFQIPAPRMKPHVARRGHTLASRTTPRPARHQVRHEHDCGRGACHRYMQLSTSQHAEYMTADSNCPSQVHHTTNTTVV